VSSIAYALRCRICEYVEAPGPATDCPRCDGPTDVAYDLKAVAAVASPERIAAGPLSLWRYGDLLPAAVGSDASTAGWTPLVRVASLSEELGVELHVKLETANAGASYKDRTAALAGAAAAALGLETICCTSTGSLGRAVAADAAARGLEAIVLAPAGTGATARAAGAHVIELDGSWQECRAVERRLAGLFPWGVVAANLHPYAVEGPKTISFEIAEQLGWEAPDAVVCPVGSGALLAKVAQGFHELRAVGLLGEATPRLVGAQSGGYSPVAAAFAAGGAIAAGDRAFEDLALGAARTSGGAVLSVPARDVDGYAEMLAAAIGVEVDGAGGASLGALVQAVRTGLVRAGEGVVVVVSGVRKLPESRPEPARAVAPELDRVLAVLGVE